MCIQAAGQVSCRWCCWAHTVSSGCCREHSQYATAAWPGRPSHPSQVWPGRMGPPSTLDWAKAGRGGSLHPCWGGAGLRTWPLGGMLAWAGCWAAQGGAHQGSAGHSWGKDRAGLPGWRRAAVVIAVIVGSPTAAPAVPLPAIKAPGAARAAQRWDDWHAAGYGERSTALSARAF